MNRDESLRTIGRGAEWDVVVIGGGATGLGSAVDAAARGYRTLLLEQGDFAQGTSSRSTKLIHGGLRYLRGGNIHLVRQALHERGLLLRNAPDLVHRLDFIIPMYEWWESAYYRAGLAFYDLLAGSLRLGRSRYLSRTETLEQLSSLAPDRLRGGILYNDAQFDDARLAIALAHTFSGLGGTALNYAPVVALLKNNSGMVRGVRGRDVESGDELEIVARVVINATGVFCDALRELDHPNGRRLIVPSQGAHVVVDSSFLPGHSALMIPRTDDGRVLFTIPWHGRVLIGTTDTPVGAPVIEPRPLASEIDFLLAHTARYLVRAPSHSDVRSAFAGLRPLVDHHSGKKSSSLPRDHTIEVSDSGLVTITGGKWTTYRLMAEEAVDVAARTRGLKPRPCTTTELSLRVAPLLDGPPLHSALPYSAAQVTNAVRTEMARTVADVLARRTRALILDARAAMEVAPRVASLIAKELARDQKWEEAEVRAFHALARGYLPEGHESSTPST